LQFRNEQLPGDTMFFGQGVMDNAMKPVKEKDGGESMVIDRPGAGGGAGFEQVRKVQNDDVFPLPLRRRKLVFTKDEIVDCRLLEKIGHSCLGPGGKLSFPIALGALRDRFFQVF
jgi:hypothetical protein